jgi:hypothetical protein
MIASLDLAATWTLDVVLAATALALALTLVYPGTRTLMPWAFLTAAKSVWTSRKVFPVSEAQILRAVRILLATAAPVRRVPLVVAGFAAASVTQFEICWLERVSAILSSFGPLSSAGWARR